MLKITETDFDLGLRIVHQGYFSWSKSLFRVVKVILMDQMIFNELNEKLFFFCC